MEQQVTRSLFCFTDTILIDRPIDSVASIRLFICLEQPEGEVLSLEAANMSIRCVKRRTEEARSNWHGLQERADSALE